MAASDARPVPRKNVAYRHYFTIRDATTRMPVTGATGLDSEISLDDGGFSDCINEATEIGSKGVYFIDLTAGEMNADAVIVLVGTSTVNAEPPIIFLYPETLGDYRVDLATEFTTAITAIIAGILTTPGQTIDTTVAGEVTIDTAQLATLLASIVGGILVNPANPIETDASGHVVLQSDGVDNIVIETGVNLRQAISAIASGIAGVLAGVGTGTITTEAINNPGTVRITITSDLVGNRPTVVLNLPA